VQRRRRDHVAAVAADIQPRANQADAVAHAGDVDEKDVLAAGPGSGA
jgi:hypothetical protein